MKRLLKILATIIVAVILISSVFVIYYFSDYNLMDNTPPSIKRITGNTTGTTGKITKIEVSFSDNKNVTEAIIYFKSASASIWNSSSIISGSYDIEIPKNPIEDWYYYITVNDEAGNGPVGNPSKDGSSYYTISVKEDRKELVHNVFIEEGTGTWCSNCPEVANILHELYESGDYNFYYVSLINDTNSEANSRLKEDYNIYGYPSVYIDGGYDLIVGANEKSVFEESISKAQKREVPALYLNVTAQLDNSSKKTNISIEIINYEDYTYTGRLKLYLTERNSVSYYGGQGIYHFGFIKIIYNEEINISSKEEKNIDKIDDFSEYDIDNLMVIGVIFNSQSVEKYSDTNKKNPFDAYYADASQGALIVKNANLKPEVGITNPKKGRLHIFGKEITLNKNLKNTILIGRATITIYASDDSKVEKVELYIDGTLVKTFDTGPYEYMWKKPSWFKLKHDIKVIAYDDKGKTSEAEIEVYAFILL
ncbi:MAG: Ig-like domain-containing protein [Candidatus Thermoplasmatota archaeon]|nr:Ig-like domain-containing protein [Candidatus Thermoplasmatota archaeon]